MFSKQFWAMLGVLAVLAVALERSPAQRSILHIPCVVCQPAGAPVWSFTPAGLIIGLPALRYQSAPPLHSVQQSGRADELPPADLFDTPPATPAPPHRPSGDTGHS